jgi:tRNA(Ile2) C34 agmatinyltransferase TiaS
MKDHEGYRRAMMIQNLKKLKHLKPNRHLGSADELCPQCGGSIETLLDTEGKNPFRCCWRCEVETIELEASRDDH